MFGISLLSKFSRLTVNPIYQNARNITYYKPLLFRSTPCLFGEPLKKKKKLDPAITKHREERKKKKIEKQIRRMEKHARQLKPVEELEVANEILDEKKQRTRKPIVVSPEVKEYRELLQKEWSRYKAMEHMDSIRNIDRISLSQQRALEALKEVSEDLYNAALMVDEEFYNVTLKGPVATPPIKNYDSPDGEYKDVSRRWDIV